MMPAIQIGLTAQAQALLNRFETMPQRVLVGIARGLDDANLKTVSVIQRNYLSFPKGGPATPAGLRRQSGRYRDSLRASKATIQGNAVVSAIGTNAVSKSGVSYPAVHEFGFTGTVMVGGHVRKRFQQKEFLTKSGRATRRNIRVGDSVVRPHQRRMNLPARAPIQRGIQQNLDVTKQLVSAAVLKAMSSEGGQP